MRHAAQARILAVLDGPVPAGYRALERSLIAALLGDADGQVDEQYV